MSSRAVTMSAGDASRPASAWRDPWALVPLLAVLPLVLKSLGAPLGEPFADDFFFLRRVVVPGARPWFDGGGSPVFWRPIGRQAYFGVFGSLMTAHPLAMVAVHTLLLALAGWLLYRTLRPHWTGAAAAAAACFPLLVESGRMLIGWPSHFQDVGAIVFAALALHEASRGRLGGTLAALLLALLCKEIAVTTALLVPWLPGRPGAARTRVRWIGATAGLLVLWGGAYAAVVRTGGVGFEHEAALDGPARVPVLARVGWALAHSFRGAFSLPARDGPHDALALAVLTALALLATGLWLGRAGARARLRAALPWALFGCAWFVLASASLAETYPSWSAQRCVFGAFGLGIALSALLGSAHPLLLAPLLALQLFLFAVSPAAPREVSVAPAEAGEFDFAQFVRLERIVHGTRECLQSRFPTLPHGAVVGQHGLPLMSEHAFAGSRALQVWYRDSTLRWIRFDEFARDPAVAVAAFVEYQPHAHPRFALVEAAAMRGLLSASDLIREARWEQALGGLEAAESAQRDTAAKVFLATTASKRALCLSVLGRNDEAERAAREGIRLWPGNPDSRYVLAEVWLAERRFAEAVGALEAQLQLYPGDRGASELLARARDAWRAEAARAR